ncbi:MAG: hypothetical protein AABZ60_15135 [Planctomycetota bacterium]
MMFFLVSTEFWQGFWQGFFELVALGIVAYFVNVIYARRTNTNQKKQEIIDELDEFVISLWKPRKIYTLLHDQKLDFLTHLSSQESRTLEQFRLKTQAFNEFLDSIGRLRAVQIKIITFFGFQIELLAHFMAIWFYLKEVRRRMEHGETLFFGSPRQTTEVEIRAGEDDLYVLIDKFRLLIASTPKTNSPPLRLKTHPEEAKEVQRHAQEIYRSFFGEIPAEIPSAKAPI